MSTPATDPVTAYLAAVRLRANWTRSVEGVTVTTGGARASAEDVPVLLAALEAVLANHAELKDGPFASAGYCPTCWRIWPCETYRAISAALRDTQGGAR